MLLSVGSSFSFITGLAPEDHPIDQQLISFSKLIYDNLGKKYTSSIKKEEIVTWAKEHVFGRGYFTINDIVAVLKNGIEAVEEAKEES